MIVNGQALLDAAPIRNMLPGKERFEGVSHGLAEAGYDIRLKQQIEFTPTRDTYNHGSGFVHQLNGVEGSGRFTKASAIEEFQMPDNLVGIVHDKSTWARMGLSVFNTVIEPGWHGFLTLELVYHGENELILPAGAGIAQVIFHTITEPKAYSGKYQGQADAPIAAKFEE